MATSSPSPRWTLQVDGRPVAPLRIADTRWARTRGLLGQEPPSGALWLPRTSSVHSIGMRYPLDVAACDVQGRVLAVRRLDPWQVLWPRRATVAIVEAGAGSFGRWQLAIGSWLVAVAEGRPEPATTTR